MSAAPYIAWAAEGALWLLLPLLLIRYFMEAFSLRPPRIARLLRANEPKGGPIEWRKLLLAVGGSFVVSRAFFFLAALGYAACIGQAGEWLSGLPGNLVRWDAHHYLGLIENWYVNEGDPRFHIVFFPLYPFLGRGLYCLGLSPLVSGLIVSNASCLVAGGAMYALARGEGSGRDASRATWLLMLNPVSFFSSLPFSEGLFLALTLLSVVFARKRKFGLAVLFGALSANARMLGMATAIPIFWEMLREASESASGRDLAKKCCLCVARVLPVAAGLGAYLLLNYAVTGDPFRFLTYQAEHWSQTFGSVHNTLTYTFQCMLSFGSRNYQLFVFWPQYVASILVIYILCRVWRRLHPGDAAFALVYFVCAIAPTWLLSGSRYLSVMYPLYPALTRLTERRVPRIIVFAAEILCGAYMAAGYAVIGGVI